MQHGWEFTPSPISKETNKVLFQMTCVVFTRSQRTQHPLCFVQHATH